jgi:hypothetical protein
MPKLTAPTWHSWNKKLVPGTISYKILKKDGEKRRQYRGNAARLQHITLCNDDNVDNEDDVDNKVKIEDKDLEELLHFGSLICGEEVVDIRSVNELDRKRILNRCREMWTDFEEWFEWLLEVACIVRGEKDE